MAKGGRSIIDQHIQRRRADRCRVTGWLRLSVITLLVLLFAWAVLGGSSTPYLS